VKGDNNSKFCDFVDHFYPIETEIKDITYTAISASYLDINLNKELEHLLKLYLWKPHWIEITLCCFITWTNHGGVREELRQVSSESGTMCSVYLQCVLSVC